MPILVLLSVIPITVLWGRFFCGYLCAFGSMQELISFVAKKIKIKQIKFKSEIDMLLKEFKYVILLLLMLLWIFNISLGNYSSWNVFGIYSSYKGWSDLTSWISIGGVLLCIIIVSSLFIERAFCRYFCPLGGIFSIISKPRLYKIKKNSKCVNCNLCTKECPMNIDVNRQTFELGKIKSGECIDCFRCVNSCNSKALYTDSKESISGTIASIAISGIYFVGTITAESSIGNVNNVNSVGILQGKYMDGTYEGSGKGYRSTINVKVKVESGNISSITIVNHNEDEPFFSNAKNVISEIILNQTTDVKTVSGATYSSNGIIDAVVNALSITENISVNNIIKENVNSNINSSTNTNNEINNDSNNVNTNIVNSSSLSNIADGTYEGSGKGYKSTVIVKVKVESGKISSITIVSHNDDEPYFNKAKNVVDKIILNQTINVQTVSGATYSCNGIIEAVANALGILYDNPNNKIQNNYGDKGKKAGVKKF